MNRALRELDSIALRLFPAWLPGAEHIDRSGGAGTAAVRALARRAATRTDHFAPFLADLAERALHGGGTRRRRFPAEVRASGLNRVIRASFQRPRTALLVAVPPGLPPTAERALADACGWLADHGRFAVGLTDTPLTSVDWLDSRPVPLPADLAELVRRVRRDGPEPPGATAPSAPAPPILSHPPLAGRPHPASRAEHRLEEALAPCSWAAGRAWNQTFHPHPLAPSVRIDLMWTAERCAVEIDGPEHRTALRFAADRRRDVLLQLHGYAVLRFTNDQVLTDVASVVHQLRRFLERRRHPQKRH